MIDLSQDDWNRLDEALLQAEDELTEGQQSALDRLFYHVRNSRVEELRAMQDALEAVMQLDLESADTE